MKIFWLFQIIFVLLLRYFQQSKTTTIKNLKNTIINLKSKK